MQWTILATKLHQPPRPPRQVRRERLIQRLNEGLEAGRPLTLVSAPAGFGKTICVLDWLAGLNLPVAWLSLEKTDDDPGRFFAYLIAALQQVDVRLGREIDAAIRSGQLPPVEIIATTLINDLLQLERGFLLVIDDFQVIQERAILQVIEKIIANQPRTLHLVLLTREDPLLPLARLRANNGMTEIRAADLRFTNPEIAAFLQEVMGLSLSETDISTLEQRTEGWIAGLQLAGLAMQGTLSTRGRGDPSNFIAGLSGSHRYILSYLTEEVISRQPEEIQSFLLQTSILDRLTGPLCDMVTGRTGSDLLLERLFNANLFLIPLDDDQQWYRYHHLFADLLRSLQNRAPRAETLRLHLRASQWYAAEGMVAEAIQHAIAGEDFQQAVALIEKHVMSVIMQGYFKTVEGWFQAIPAEWHTRSPRANMALAGMHLMRGNYALVAQHLQQARPALFAAGDAGGPLASEDAPLRSEWLAIHANLCNVQGKAAESLEAAGQALHSAREDDTYVLGLAYLAMGGAYRLIGDYPRLVEAYQKAIQHSRAAGNWLSEMLSATSLGLMAIQHGKLRFARESALQVIHRVEQASPNPPPVVGPIYGVRGQVHYEWNELASARQDFQRGLQLSLLGGHNAGLVFAHALLSRLALAEGDLPAAAQSIQQAADLLAQDVPAWLKPEVILQQVRVALSQGNPAAAETVLTSLGINWHGPISRPLETYFLAYLRPLLYRIHAMDRTDEADQALAVADRLVDSSAAGARVHILLQALLLRAQLRDVLNDPSAAQEDTTRALELGEPEGYLRTFIDEGPALASLLAQVTGHQRAYATRLLAAFPQPVDILAEQAIDTTAQQTMPIPEALTERELDVLRLIAEGLKYEQIAERLVISVNTVRFYVKEIYSKLQVNNRTQAIENARKLGLL